MSVFETVKAAVTTRQAVEFYGLEVKRGGMVCCPFHQDRHPSMKVDARFHCFGCGADGDVIDFTARLYGLSKLQAAVHLAEDFGLAYSAEPRQPKPRVKSPQQQYRQAQDRCYRGLIRYYHWLKRWADEFAPEGPGEDWHPGFVEAMERLGPVEHALDTLLQGSLEEQARVVRAYGKECLKLEDRLRRLDETGRGGHAENP